MVLIIVAAAGQRWPARQGLSAVAAPFDVSDGPAIATALLVSLASALGPVIRAMRVVPAMAFREIV